MPILTEGRLTCGSADYTHGPLESRVSVSTRDRSTIGFHLAVYSLVFPPTSSLESTYKIGIMRLRKLFGNRRQPTTSMDGELRS